MRVTTMREECDDIYYYDVSIFKTPKSQKEIYILSKTPK